MAHEQVKQITERHVALWSAHDAHAVADLYAEDCVYEDIPQRLSMQGKQAVVKYAQEMFAAFPDITIRLRSLCVSVDHSAREYVMTGTHAATGKSVSVAGVSILEFRGTEVVRNTDYYDLSSLIRQLE